MHEFRWLARLGEYDIRTENDGKHEDILIADSKGHPEYDAWYTVNDIGIVYLKHDVVFNGKAIDMKKISNSD